MNASTQIAMLKKPLRPNTFECIRYSTGVTMFCAWCIVCHYKYICPPVSGLWQANDCSFNSPLLTWQMWLHGDCQCLSPLQLLDDEGNQFDYMHASSCILFLNPADRYGEPMCILTACYIACFTGCLFLLSHVCNSWVCQGFFLINGHRP